jgi:hypothetical protein
MKGSLVAVLETLRDEANVEIIPRDLPWNAIEDMTPGKTLPS